MKKQNPLILNIPTPCSESWAEMSPSGNGRFCSHCQKTVTDITTMSDTEVVQLFQSRADMHCIRAFASQLNRPITLPPQVPTRFYRIAVALGLTIMMAGAADAYSRPRAPLTELNYLLETGDSTRNTSSDSVKISGIVVDETGEPFPGVVVKLLQCGILKGGTMTEDDGTFIFVVKKDIYDLEFRANSFETKILEINTNTKESIIQLQTKMQELIMGLSHFEIVEIQKPEDVPGKKTYNSNDLKKLGY